MIFADSVADSVALPLSLVFSEIVRALYSLPSIRRVLTSPQLASNSAVCGVQRLSVHRITAVAKHHESVDARIGSLLGGDYELAPHVLIFVYVFQYAYLDIDLFSVWKQAVADGTLKARLMLLKRLPVFI